MLSVNGVTQSYGGKVLFDNVTESFSPGKRYGLTGPNGAGKSTFMKFLAGIEDPMKGSVSRPKKTSFLRQDHYRFDEVKVLDTVLMGNAPLWEAMQAKNKLLAKMEAGGELTDDEGMQLGEIEGVVGEEDGYTAEADAAVLLDGLGIKTEQHGLLMKQMSGGLKLRVLLAQALFGKPQCLLLDEPTNHLDLDSIHWLEDFLTDFEGVLVVISHDKHFLNAVTTHIADIDYEQIIVYTGNYDDMVLQKVQIRGRLEQENQDKQKKVSQLKEFIARFGAGTRSAQATSRRKEIEKLELNQLKRSNIARPFIKFELGEKPSGKHVLRVENLSKSFVEKGKPDIVICKNLFLNIMRGDKVAIIGPSGIGKTTLLRLIRNEVSKDEGEIAWGHEVRVGYFAQDHREGIPHGVQLWHWLQGFDEKATREDVRGLLGRMLFTGEEGEKMTDVLSGGETARLLFSKLMLLKNNVLIFDEPTNHLDLESISALRDAIVKFEGTVIFVTHDRDLVSDAATRIIAMSAHGIDDFNGPYKEFREKVGEVRLDR
ncbi:MAG: ATP-binding cassette domain-containing protein [Deltaproteobacteria bacterium]|nr:ATP-binding cassette domain-containing protein [Deltaproteobacteria bacterium]